MKIFKKLMPTSSQASIEKSAELTAPTEPLSFQSSYLNDCILTEIFEVSEIFVITSFIMQLILFQAQLVTFA
jgi:hypothetical protein